MSYNIREHFSYVLTTSSIEYVRNYNFNSATVSDIPLVLSNSGSTIPITVNMTTSDEWVKLVNPITGKSVRMPEGNVVVTPNSNVVVLVKIDLPENIETIPQTTIYPSITFDIKSGSALIVAPTPPDETTGTTKNTIRAPSTIELTVGQVQEIVIHVYDNAGVEEDAGSATWEVDNTNVAIIEESDTQVDGLNRKNVRGVAPGTTKITYVAGTRKTTTEVTVTGTTNTSTTTTTTTTGGDNTCGNRCVDDTDCSGVCSSCTNSICVEPNQN
jgi:hypothetical protein